MSATGRSDVRDARDYYRTPGWCVDAILPHLPPIRGARVLDLGCGDGAIGEALGCSRDPVAGVVGVELDAELARAAQASGYYEDVVMGDAMGDEAWRYLVARRWDMAIGNPPYKHARAFCDLGRECAAVSAQLLRLSFLGSQKRCEWWQRNPADVYVLSRRPSFTGRGTDSADYAWFVWGPGPRGRVTVLT